MIEPKVFSEVYTILNQLEDISVKKIPEKLFNQIKENATIEINYIDKDIPLEKLRLKKETKEFLAIISYYYFCDDEERKKWDEVLTENERKYQEKLKERYNPDNLFKSKEEVKKTNNKEIPEDKDEFRLIEYKENFIIRLINKIKEFFKRK